MYPLVSIIVPVYNSEEFISRCLSSIQRQTYDNLEVIIIDDGSTDRSYTVCKQFKKMDSRFKLVRKPNGGVASARNLGLKQVSGDYVGFVDSDDHVDPRMYQLMMEAALSSHADIVECGFSFDDADTDVITKYPLKNSITKGNFNCCREYLISENTRNYNCNKIYRRGLLVNITYSNHAYSEDFLFNCKTFLRCNIKATIAECLYYYVQHKNSACGKPITSQRFDGFLAAEEAIALFNGENPALTPFVAMYLLNFALSLYKSIEENETENKKQLQKKIVEYYNLYYPLYRRINHNMQPNLKDRLVFLSFRVNPRLFYHIHRIKKSIRSKTLL